MARTITFQQAINEALAQEMKRDETVVVFGEDVVGGSGAPGEDDAWGGVLGVTKGLYGQFPDRVLDTPISESALIGAAAGAAASGLRPVAELMFVDFLGVCLDQIFNQAAKFRYMFGGKAVTPMVIRTMFGAGIRAASQHSQALYPIFTHIPGLKVVVPSSPYDAKGLLIQAIRDDDPVIFLEHKVLYTLEGEVPEEAYAIPFGEAEIVREGSDVTVVALGRMVHLAAQAAEALSADGIECEIVDPRTTSPLDEETILESVESTGRLVVVDEANPRCGFASDIISLVSREAFGALEAAPRMVTPPHTPVPFSPVLEDAYVPTPETIAEAIRLTTGSPRAGMIEKLGMPKWGLSMTEGRVVDWLVSEGAEIAVGDEIAEVETEKINGVVEAPVAGVLRRRVAASDDVIPVGGLLGVIADASVPEAEIDAFVAEFEASFVPGESDADAAPEPQRAGELRYLLQGDGGEPVVLLHGFGGDLNNWLFNAPALSGERAVYALDLPGHGGSVKEARDLTGAVRGFLDELGIASAHLVGHSMGGLVAGELAAAEPDRVLSLTLIAPAGLGSEIDASYIDGFVAATGRKDLKPVLQRLFADPSLVNRSMVDDVLKYKRLDGVQGALETLRDELFADGRQARSLDLDAYHGPLLVIWGAEDAIIPASHAEAAPSRAEVRVLDGVGHSPHMEAAGEVNRLLEGFIAGVRT